MDRFHTKVTNTWSLDEPPGYLRFVQERLSTSQGDIEEVLGGLERESAWCDTLGADLLFTREVLGGDEGQLQAFKAKTDKLCEAIYDEVIATYGNVDPVKAAISTLDCSASICSTSASSAVAGPLFRFSRSITTRLHQRLVPPASAASSLITAVTSPSKDMGAGRPAAGRPAR